MHHKFLRSYFTMTCAALKHQGHCKFLLRQGRYFSNGIHFFAYKNYSMFEKEVHQKVIPTKEEVSFKEHSKSDQISLLAMKMLQSEKGRRSGNAEKMHHDRVYTDNFSSDEFRCKLKTLATNMEETNISNLDPDFESNDMSIILSTHKEFVNAFEDKENSHTGEDSVEQITFEDDLRDYAAKGKVSPLLGTEDPNVETSRVPCVGCGAHIQCRNRTLPGFIASEYFKLLTEKELKTTICQRCYYIQHFDTFMEVSKTPEEYAEIISKIRPIRSVVVMVVDVMDIAGSIVPLLSESIGNKHPLVVVGNKADLLAPDCPDYLRNVKYHLKKACMNAGLKNVKKCTLISAKTGYGIEKLINILFSFYKQRVDVFIVGTANAGKSSLFNILLGSDYCKHLARDLIQRATVSVWPGTTLSMLKFPIMRPSSRTTALRYKRLNQEKALQKEKLRLDRERSKHVEERNTWQLKESVTATDVRTPTQRNDDEQGKEWGQEVVSYKGRHDGSIEAVTTKQEPTPFEDEGYKDSYWVFDTPGIINPDQVMNYLTPGECRLIAPTTTIVPRAVVLGPGETMFVSGIARLDYFEGDQPIYLVVHSSSSLPIRIGLSDDAGQYYEEHVGSDVLGIPLGDVDRMCKLPSLVGQEIIVEGEGPLIAAADIQLSSVGWVSVALRRECKAKLRAFTPCRKGIHLRKPALLPHFTKFRGKRIAGTSFYRTLPPGSVVMGKTAADLSES